MAAAVLMLVALGVPEMATQEKPAPAAQEKDTRLRPTDPISGEWDGAV